MDVSSTTKAVEDSTRWKGLVVKSNNLARLWDGKYKTSLKECVL